MRLSVALEVRYTYRLEISKIREMSRSGKGKTLLGVVIKLFFFSSICKTHAKQNMIFSISTLAEWAQKFKFLYTSWILTSLGLWFIKSLGL
jgi:hypothetical protein